MPTSGEAQVETTVRCSQCNRVADVIYDGVPFCVDCFNHTTAVSAPTTHGSIVSLPAA